MRLEQELSTIEKLKSTSGRLLGAATLMGGMLLAAPEMAVADDYLGGEPTTTTTTPETPSSSSTLVPSESETTTTTTIAQTQNTLPVTGGDVLALTAIGAGAVATGVALLRRSRRNDHAA